MSAPTWFDEAMRLAVEYAICHSELTRSRDAYSLAAVPRAEKALRAHLQGRDAEFEQNRELAVKLSGALAREAVVRSQMTGEQGKAGEWVEKAMDFASDALIHAESNRPSLRSCSLIQLRTHLTAHAQAESAVRGALLEELTAVHALISEASATGLNPHDGDWADRLFAGQYGRFSAIALARAGEGKS